MASGPRSRHFGPGTVPVQSESTVRYRRSPSVLFRRTAAGLLLATGDGDDAVELGGSGEVLWDLLQEPMTIADLVGCLAAIFDAAPEVIWQSVESTLSELVTMSAVTVTDVG